MLPAGQAAMLGRTCDVHQYAMRSARAGLAMTARDHRVVGYRVPKEWATLIEGLRAVRSLAAFKRRSKAGPLAGYGSFVCGLMGCVCPGADFASLGT